jgi:hypothetical protein
MALCINQTGTYRRTTSLRVNQSGTYRTIVNGCINQSGTYRCFGMTRATASLSLSPSTYQHPGSSTISWSSTRATCVVSCSGSGFNPGQSTSGSATVSPSTTTTYTLVTGNAFCNSTTASATLTVTLPALGSSFGGGRLICRSSPVRWVVSPVASSVNRNWYSRGDANTRAQQVSGVSGWFVPTRAQLNNPGYSCRTYWDAYSTGGNHHDNYWSNDF